MSKFILKCNLLQIINKLRFDFVSNLWYSIWKFIIN